MDWKDVANRALWTAAEAMLAAVILFLAALGAAWLDAGSFTVPSAAVVVLAVGALSAIAAGLTVVKEWVKSRLAS